MIHKITPDNVTSGSKRKVWWKCPTCLQQWRAAVYSVCNGTRCPHCAGNTNKSIGEIRTHVEEKGGKLLSAEYLNSTTKLQVICKNKHKFSMTWDCLKQGQWCPYCAGNVKKSIGEIKTHVEEKGGKLLSNEYVNAHSKLQIICKNNHKFSMTWAKLQQGKWCLYCGQPNKCHSRR